MANGLTPNEIAQFDQALRRARTETAQDATVIDDILDALDRIGEGTFGRCELCREWLPREKLLAVPWARRCAACEGRQAGSGGAQAGAG